MLCSCAWLRTAHDQKGLSRLREVLVENTGFVLFQSVERAKQTLSHAPESLIHFDPGSFTIEETVTRLDFETAIERAVRKLEACVDDLLQEHGLRPDDISTVFLTGGSSRIPRIRQIFTQRFEDRIVSRDSLSSVGQGLGLEAAARFGSAT